MTKLVWLALLFWPTVTRGQNLDSLYKALDGQTPLAQVMAVTRVPYTTAVANLPGMRQLIDKVRPLSLAVRDTFLLAQFHEKIALVAYLEGKYDESTREAIQSANFFHAVNKTENEGSLYCALGYQTKRTDMKKALEYMRTGLKLLQSATDTGLVAPALSNYGVLMEMNGQLDSAVFYYQWALKLQKALNDSLGIPFSLNKLGGALLLHNEPQRAHAAFKQAYAIRKARNDRYGIQENTIYFGDYYLMVNKPDSAIYYFKAAVDSSFVLNIPYQRQYCYEQLISAFRQKGDLARALDYALLSTAIKDSLLTTERAKQIAEYETRFETARKENENLELRSKQAIQVAAITRQRMWLSVLGALLIVLSMAVVAYTVWRKQREKAKLQSILIEQKEERLRSIIEAQETERREIARDLHDGAVQTLTGIKMRLQRWLSLSQLDAELKSGLSQTVTDMDQASHDLRAMSHRMMPRALSEGGLAPAFDDMLHNILGPAQVQWTLDVFLKPQTRFTEHVEVAIFRIGQELVNNILKHAQATQVGVQLSMTGENLQLLVEDNGRGFDTTDLEKSGIGLLNIRTRAEAIGAQVEFESYAGQGTVVRVRVKVA